ncbi:hypothetical protein LCGC14_3077430, partial [marine sediment metagenome]
NTTPGLPEVLPHLWIARYDNRLNEQSGQPWVEGGPQEYVEPRDYDTWAFWQYTETADEKPWGVTAGAIGIDLSVFNGTQEELDRYAGVEEPPVAVLPDVLGVKINVEFPKGVDVKFEGKVYRV